MLSILPQRTSNYVTSRLHPRLAVAFVFWGLLHRFWEHFVMNASVLAISLFPVSGSHCELQR
jgi:hypothetical protein